MFPAIKKQAEKLQASEGQNDPKYYELRESLCDQLREFLKSDFLVLNKADFILLCCLASKYRPVEPWQFLLRISMLRDKQNQPLKATV